MNSNPLVSILMTAYNREKYIGEAIECVLASTYTNFELIIVDDGSNDNTVSIVKTYEKNDRRIKLYVNEKNIGQFNNRNLAATYAQGIYLKYLDSDDLIYPNGLEILINVMERFPEAAYGLCSIEQDVDKIFPFILSPIETYERHFCKKKWVFHKAPLSSIIRKEIFFNVGGFANQNGDGDYEMWLHLSCNYNVVLIQDGIVWYREHDDQIDFQRRNDPLISFRYFLITLNYMMDNCPLDKAVKIKIIKETHSMMVRNIIKVFFNYSPKKASQMFKMANYNIFSFFKKCLQSILTKG